MFTNNWFQVTAKHNFEKYILPISLEKNRKLKFLEIGCYEGQATLWMLENSSAKVTVIDTFLGSKEHDAQFEKTLLTRFIENVEKYQDRIETLVGTSQEMLKSKAFKRKRFDFIYVDGSHQASDVLEDAVLAFPLLKENGIMIFDDYTWGIGLNYYDIPSNGINAFLTIYGNKLEILEKNSQVIIKKLPIPPK